MPGAVYGSVVSGGAAGDASLLPRPHRGDFEVQDPRRVLPHLAGVQHAADHHVHGVRRQDAQNSRELQRVQVHRLHDVHHLHHLARVYSYLLRDWQLVRGRKIILFQYDQYLI